MKLIMRLRQPYKAPYPRGYALCWHEDFRCVSVVAPYGLHWLLRGARWLHKGVAYRASLALEPHADGWAFSGYKADLGLWPFMRYVDGDNVAARRGYGLCWSQAPSPSGGGRYIAPIGLNLVYALVRAALPD